MSWTLAIAVSITIPCDDEKICPRTFMGLVPDPRATEWVSEERCKEHGQISVAVFNAMAESRGWQVNFIMPKCRELEPSPTVDIEDMDIVG